MPFIKITSMSLSIRDWLTILLFGFLREVILCIGQGILSMLPTLFGTKKRFHILQLLAAQFSSDKTKRLIPSGHHWHASYGEDMSRLFNMKDNLTLISWSPPLLDGLNWIQNRAYSSTGSRAACGGISLDYINVLYILL